MKSHVPADPCLPFQLDLSCLVDRELEDDRAVRRALVHLEVCGRCRRFFDAIRGQVLLHRELADRTHLLGKIQEIDGSGVFAQGLPGENLRRLAAVFYRLGKAYLLLAVDRRYMVEVFEEPVPPAAFKASGYRWVSRVCRRSAGEGADWVEARSLLNGKLDSVADNLEKARALLGEALIVKPNFAEARLYFGFWRQSTGDLAGAEGEYRRVFRTARRLENRTHAAVQLGQVWHERRQFRRAAGAYRWAIAKGAARRDSRFFFVHYNLGLVLARLGRYEACVEAFRTLAQRYPESAAKVRSYLEAAPHFRSLLVEKPEFRARLVRACGAVFAA
ncbi:MAG TPA: tetratricopeptide repeat protein [Planctomycetota bacterium]|jgi:tetratricopeptide (TPR) repeat protein|nr:tetratricopeptide repeat protein [Planctomycetota bacterium]